MSNRSNASRVREIRVAGMRTLDRIAIAPQQLAVMIGENGAGKSTTLEAIELIRRLVTTQTTVNDLCAPFGGIGSVVRRGCSTLELGLTLEIDSELFDYDVKVLLEGSTGSLVTERVKARSHSGEAHLYERSGTSVTVVGASGAAARPLRVASNQSGLQVVAPLSGQVGAVLRAISSMEIHAAIDSRPIWQQRELEQSRGPRWPSLHERVERLSRYGRNLTNCVQQLRNSTPEAWTRVVERARFGLGHDLVDLRPTPVGAGNVDLSVLLASGVEVRLSELSEGQICYLCFIVMLEFGQQSALLAIDEPELHLHPDLLARVVFMLEESAKVRPVLLATHSERLLDTLTDPAGSVMLCELDESRRTTIRRPDRVALDEWLKTYRGVGSIRSAGYSEHIFETRGEGS